MKWHDDIDPETSGFADLYDELPLWSAPFGLQLLDRVPVNVVGTILDVGAGTGFMTVELAERCGERATVIAVDPWVDAVDRLRRKVESRGLTNVDPVVGDAATLALPDESVDVIVSNLGINNFENPRAVVDVCFRVAKPNATFLVTTNLTGHMAELYDAYRSVLIESGQHDRLPILESHIEHRGTIETITTLIRDAGFSLVEVVESSFRWRFANGTSLLGHYFIRLGFMSAWKAVVMPDSIDETFTLLERRLNEIADEKGELALTIPMACFVARKVLTP